MTRRAGPARAEAGEAGTTDRQFVTALARGLDVLGCFSAARTSLGATEVAEMLDLPQPTVWRLCHTLTELGHLARDGNERLRPALPALRLGFSALSELSPTELARPYLQELAGEFRGAAGVAVADGPDMRFVERCEGKSQLLMSLRVGSRVPVASSALGWAYLAAVPEAERAAVFAAAAAANAGATRRIEAAFRRALKDYERTGFIVNECVFHPGYRTAAVPVPGPDGRVAFALNCGGATSILPAAPLRDQVGPRLRALAAMLAAII